MQHVPDAAKGRNMETEFASLVSIATQTRKKLSNMSQKRKNNIKLLQPFCNEIKTSFKNMRKNVIHLMNQIEHNADVEMERLLSILEKQLQSDIQSSRDIDLIIKNLLDREEKLKKLSETLAFQITKKCKQELQFAETWLQINKADVYKLEFTADPRIEELLASMETPGHLTISPVLQVSSACTYTVTGQQVYGIEEDVGQRRKSLITGICHLPEGQIVIVDQGTKDVKLLNYSFSVVAIQMNFGGCIPQDVCHTIGQEIAVSSALPIDIHSRSYYQNPKTQVTCMDRQLNELKTFNLNVEVKSIAYKDGFFYIASQNAVQKHHKNGQIMKIYQDQPQRSAPGSSYNVALCRSNKISLCSTSKKLFITNMDKNCLITMDDDGQILSQLNDPDLQEPTAVCAADNSTVFVYSKKNNTVFQVDPNLRKITILATDKEGLLYPRCMCFDDKRQRLLVEQADNILVLKLKIK